MRTITLQAVSAWDAFTTRPTDVVVGTQESFYTGQGGHMVPFTYETYTYPELGPVRLFDRQPGAVVVTIRGRRCRVTFPEAEGRFDEGAPTPGAFTFQETDEVETPSMVWDAMADLADKVAAQEARVERGLAEGSEWGAEEVLREMSDLDQMKADLARGVYPYGLPGELAMFGQPHFIQNPVFPSRNGKSALHLCTLFNDWGDCGNENYLVALDDDGYPVALYHEASCC